MKTKKIICLICAVVILLTFSACGRTEKFDKLPQKTYQTQTALEKMDYRALVGGAFAVLDRSLYEENELSGEAEKVIVLFDETQKALVSLCQESDCLHNSDDCFERRLRYVVGTNNSYWDIVDGEILIIDGAFGRVYGEGHKDSTLTAYYFGFDGTLTDKIELDLNSLEKADGKKADRPMLSSAKAEYGGTVFLEAGEKFTRIKSGGSPRWIIPYNTDEKMFEPATEYIHNYWKIDTVFREVGRNLVGVTQGTEYVYIVDTLKRTYTEVFLNSAIRSIERNGHSEIDGIYPLKGLIRTEGQNGAEDVYWDYDTLEPVSLSISEEKLLDGYEMISVGKKSYCSVENGLEDTLEYVEVKKNENVQISRFFESGGCKLQEMVFESEKGLVFRFLKTDGSGDCSLVYVYKKDFFDGNIDEPWYYDAETYSFVKR